MRGKFLLFSVLALIGFFLVYPFTGFAARDNGYDLTSELWAKAILEVSGSPVILKWKVVGTDITPSGDQVISGYFYADPADFAYGSQYNPELFVKIYIAAANGWCNIAFNHVTVDPVTVYSAHHYAGTPDHTGCATLANRLVEHQYAGVTIQNTAQANGGLAPASIGTGYIMTTGLWAKAVLQPDLGPVTLIWKEVGTDTTPSGDKVVSGYFYADPGDFAYGSEFNPEVFVKIYIATSGWCNIAFNHVTVDDIDISSSYPYDGAADQSGTARLNNRLLEHQYTGVGKEPSANLSFSPITATDSAGLPLALSWRYRVNNGQPMSVNVEGLNLVFSFDALTLGINPGTLIRQAAFSGRLSGVASGNFNVAVRENLRAAAGKTLIDAQDVDITLNISAQGESLGLSIEASSEFYNPAEWFLDRTDLDQLPIGYTYNETGTVNGMAHVTVSISGAYNDFFSTSAPFTSPESWTITGHLDSLVVNGKTYTHIVQVGRSTIFPVYENGQVNNVPIRIDYWVARGIGMVKSVGQYQLFGKLLTVDLLSTNLKP